MPRISLAFFTVAALCGLTGMFWGMHMGMSHDHTMFPAHAHLNLVGWVTLSLMGGFYALAGEQRIVKPLAWANFVLSSVGVIVMVALLSQLLAGKEKQFGPLMPLGEVPVVLGMLCFIASIAVVWRRSGKA